MSSATPQPTLNKRPSSSSLNRLVKKGQKLNFSILPYGDPREQAVRRILPESEIETETETGEENTHNNADRSHHHLMSLTPQPSTSSFSSNTIIPLGRMTSRRKMVASATATISRTQEDREQVPSSLCDLSPIKKELPSISLVEDEEQHQQETVLGVPSSNTARSGKQPHHSSSKQPLKKTTSMKSSRPSTARTVSSNSMNSQRIKSTTSRRNNVLSSTTSEKIIPFFNTLIDQSAKKATELSLSAASETSTLMQLEKYEQSKQEVAVTSLASLEGISDLLSAFGQKQKQQHHDANFMSLFCDDEASSKIFSELSSLIKKSLVGLRNVVLSKGEGLGNQLFGEHDDDCAKKSLIFDDLEKMIKNDTIDRIKNYHRALFSSYLHHPASSSSAAHDEQNNISARQNNKSPSKAKPVYRELAPLITNPSNSSFASSSLQKETIKKSLRIDETAPMSARLKNCDRMLERMRKEKKFKHMRLLSKKSVQNNISDRVEKNDETKMTEEENMTTSSTRRESVEDIDEDSSSSIDEDENEQETHHQHQNHSTTTTTINVWADAEDALHVMKMRFVFHLWKIVSRCEKQRRMNSYRMVRALTTERAKVLQLHTFLSFKRSQAISVVAACKSLMKENKQLKFTLEEHEENYKRAIHRIEQVTMLYRHSQSELEKLREIEQERVRSPMIIDFRKPLRDVLSGREIERGVIEFRSVKTRDDENGKNGKSRKKNSSSVFSVDPNEVYPPFVDWSCPSQNEHSKQLLKDDILNRLSEKKGVAMPGFKLPRSFYEIRITHGDVGSCLKMNKLTSTNNNKHSREHTNNEKQSSSSSSSSSSSLISSRISEVRHLVNEYFATSFSSKRWDLEMCSVINGILGKFGIVASDSKNSEQNHEENEEQKEKEDQDESEEQTDEVAEEEWDLNEPFCSQIVQREILGCVISSANQYSSHQHHQSHAATEPTTDATSSSFSDFGMNDHNMSSAFSHRPRRLSGVASAEFSALFSASPSSSANFDASKSHHQFHHHSYLPPSIDAVVRSIQKAEHAFASLQQQLFEATDGFISSTTEQFLEEAKLKEEIEEKNRKDVIKNLDRENTYQRSQFHAEAENELDDAGEKSQKNMKDLMANFSPCAVAPSLLPPYLILRSNHLFIDSPSDLITLPETTVRVLTVVFGKYAVFDCLKKHANHNDYHSGSFSSIATILITHLLHVSDASKYFSSSSSTTPKSNTSSNTSQQQQTVSSSSSSNNKSDITLFLGRDLGSLIQHHIIKTIASQEYEVKKMSGNAFMMRRLMSAAISSSTKNNDKRGGGK